MDLDAVRMDRNGLSTAVGLSAVAEQSVPTSNISSNTDPEAMKEKLIKGVIENFLSAIGHYDLDSLENFFAEHANISGSSLRDDIWKICVTDAGDRDEIIELWNDPALSPGQKC